MACMLLLPIISTSGLARTTYSGFRRGNGPSEAGTTLRTPSRVSDSPMNEASLAAYGPRLTSKYTRVLRALGGSDWAAACTAASITRHSRSAPSAFGTPSTWPTTPSTRRTSAWVLGSSTTTLRPRASSRSLARELMASSTTSGFTATMASMLGSMPPPSLGSLPTDAGQLE